MPNHVSPLHVGLLALASLIVAAPASAAPSAAPGKTATGPAAQVLPFKPEEFSPGSEPERALLAEIAERMGGIPKAGDTTTLDQQKLAAFKRYYTEFAGGKFRPVAVGAYAKLVRKSGKVDELLEAARELTTKEATGPRSEVTLSLLKHYLGGRGEPAKAIAVLDVQVASPVPEVSWRALIGGAQLMAAGGDIDGAIARLDKRGEKDLTPAQSVEYGYWMGRMLHQKSVELKGDERAKMEARVVTLLKRVTDACEKDPQGNANYAAAYIGLARIGLSHADAGTAKAAYEQVAKLYPASPEAQEAGMLGPQVALLGKPMPEFEGPNLEGKPWSSKSLAGKISVVDFWATTCPPCIKEMPNLVKMAADFKARPFALISISLDQAGRTSDVKELLAKSGVTWDQIYEGQGWQSTIAAKYNVTAIPSMFVVDENGIVKRVGLEGSELRDVLEEELKRLEAKK